MLYPDWWCANFKILKGRSPEAARTIHEISRKITNKFLCLFVWLRGWPLPRCQLSKSGHYPISQTLNIYLLDSGQYHETETSLALPMLNSDVLTDLLLRLPDEANSMSYAASTIG